MSREPALPPAAILKALREEYGLDLTTLTYLNAGTAHAYRADGPSGKHFLKLVPGGEYGRAMLERVRAEVPLLRALRQEEVLAFLPRPVTTLDGRDLTQVRTVPLLVSEWIEARNLEDEWTAALPELVPLLGRLHAGTERVVRHLRRLPAPPEDFALPFAAQLTRNLALVSARPPHQRAGADDLGELLLPHLPILDTLLIQARQFARAAAQAHRPFVLCHTDAHGWNVMRGNGAELWLIDWESARLAPPEHDLWMLGDHLPALHPAYEVARGEAVALHPETLCFYSVRRVLEDLAVDLQMILHDHTRPEDIAHSLHVLQDFVLPALHTLPERLRMWRDLPA